MKLTAKVVRAALLCAAYLGAVTSGSISRFAPSVIAGDEFKFGGGTG